MPKPESQPDIETIMQEIRDGLSQSSLSPETRAAAAQLASIRTSLEKMSVTAPLLGRCEGSVRGRLCKALNPLALPVTEQINLFHDATLQALRLLAGAIEDVETRLQQLEPPPKKGDAP